MKRLMLLLTLLILMPLALAAGAAAFAATPTKSNIAAALKEQFPALTFTVGLLNIDGTRGTAEVTSTWPKCDRGMPYPVLKDVRRTNTLGLIKDTETGDWWVKGDLGDGIACRAQANARIR